jgi:sialic acid synthase SpsE
VTVVIEKHFTLDKNCQEGTGHILSAASDEFMEMVDKIRRIERLLGNGIKQLSESEKEIIQFVRTRFQNE